MESNGEGKKLKHGTVDRISDMPDPILHKIISYLPTKTAISTSVLSTRWKSVFPFSVSLIMLDLDDSLLLRPRENESISLLRSFTDFVDKLLNRLVFDVPCVEIMKLHCKNYYGAAKITSWVNAALRLNVRELTLQLSIMSSTATRLFFNLNGSTPLTRLELGKRFNVWVPDGFTLPNLKVLALLELGFDEQNHNTFSRLINGCPALEELSFRHCNLQQWGIIHIKSPVLKKLAITDNWKDESMCDFELDVPKLEVLVYNDWLPGNYFLSKFKSLLRAHINVGFPLLELDDSEKEGDYDEDGPWYTRGVAMLVEACSSTVHLYLATRSIYALQHSPMQLPVFENLTCLALGCILRSEGWTILAHLLCNAPNLEKLTLEEGFSEHEGGYSSFESSVKNLPVCVELHLKEIKFLVFKEEVDEFKLIEYFLTNGKVIQKLELHCMSFKDKSTLSRLRMLPRQSKIDFQPR